MNLIITHDQAVHAIRGHVAAGDVMLRKVVLALCVAHAAQPSDSGGPDPDCWYCEGSGVNRPADIPTHCHCRCPWCAGCEEPLCLGPCRTVATIAVELGIEGLAFPVPAPQEASSDA